MGKKEDQRIVEVVIETPRGCRNKYAFDKKKKAFRLKKILPAGAVFPYDFGFIPDTEGEDGDPIDILVIMDEPAFTGCSLECRVIGALKAKQSEDGEMIQNNRLIGIAIVSNTYKDLTEIRDLNEKVKEEIQHFFVSYNKEAGKVFHPEGWAAADEAMELIQKGK